MPEPRLSSAYLVMVFQNPYLSVKGSSRHDKEAILVGLNDRGRAEEAKAALSEDLRFQAEARRNKRVGF